MDSVAAFFLGFAVGAGWRDLWRLLDRPGGQAAGRLVHRHSLTPAAVIAAAQPGNALMLRWDLNLEAFAFWGDQCRFSSRVMCYEWGVCSEKPGWTTYMDVLEQVGAIQRRRASRTRWAERWCLRTLRCVLKHGLVTMPYPAGEPPLVSSTRRGSAGSAAFRSRQSESAGVFPRK